MYFYRFTWAYCMNFHKKYNYSGISLYFIQISDADYIDSQYFDISPTEPSQVMSLTGHTMAFLN